MLVACWTLDDQERRAALLERHARNHAAFLTNWALVDTEKLQRASNELDADLDEAPDTERPDVVAAANEHIAQLHANRAAS